MFQYISYKKSVLIAASDVFAAMFRFREEQNQQQQEMNSIIEVEDVTFEAFEMLLTYIHTGHPGGLNLANLYDFLYAGEKKRTKRR